MTCRLRALDEESHRFLLTEWAHHERRLTIDAEALLAGREHRDRRTSMHDQLDNVRDRVDQVLAVVQHHQCLAPTQRSHQRIFGSSLPVLGKAHGGGDRARNKGVVVDRREVDEPRSVGETRQCLRRDLNRQPRFPDATRTGQRHHPRLPEQLRQLDQLLIAADELGHLGRQVPRKCIQGLQRWEVGWQLGMGDLKHALRGLQVA